MIEYLFLALVNTVDKVFIVFMGRRYFEARLCEGILQCGVVLVEGAIEVCITVLRAISHAGRQAEVQCQ